MFSWLLNPAFLLFIRLDGKSMQMLYFGKMPGMTEKNPRPPQNWRELVLPAGAGRLPWWDGKLGPVNHLPSRDGRVMSRILQREPLGRKELKCMPCIVLSFSDVNLPEEEV